MRPDQRVTSAPRQALLGPLRPVASLGLLHSSDPTGPMAAPRDPIDLGAPICPMEPEGCLADSLLLWGPANPHGTPTDP